MKEKTLHHISSPLWAKPQHIVVMTGATSGLGAHAVQHIAAQPNTWVIVGARGSGRTVPWEVEIIPLDLASLASVREFADAVKKRIGNSRIDMLILNAGMQTSSTEARSVDGYEMTFAVNHLAHYLLTRLLMPHMADNGRFVITTSETHDPAVAPMGPKTLDPNALAHPQKKMSGIRTYASSKLCNLMTALYLARQGDIKARHITVIAFSPGLTGGTSLGRDSSLLMRGLVTILMHTVFRLIGIFRPEYIISTPERSGAGLAKVSLGDIALPDGQIYVNLVKGKPAFPQPSELAQNPDAQDQLWRASAAMVGLD